MSKNLLITGGNSAMAMKLAKILNNYHLVLADYGDVPSLQNAQLKFVSLGVENQEVTAHQLLTACLDFQIDILLPLRLFEIEAVAKSEVLFNEFGITTVVPEFAEITHFLPTRKSTNILLQSEGLLHSVGEIATHQMAKGAFFADDQGLSLITI